MTFEELEVALLRATSDNVSLYIMKQCIGYESPEWIVGFFYRGSERYFRAETTKQVLDKVQRFFMQEAFQ
jgi:hypothetical protein